MARRRHGLATAPRLIEAFGGGPFAIAGPDPVEGPWIGGFSGFADDPQGVTLRFRVGPDRRLVEVETALRQRSTPFDDMHLVVRLLFGSAARLRFPVVIEQSTLPIKVGGRQRVFKGCSIGERVVAAARLGGVSVTISCPEGHPGNGLMLARLEGAALNDAVSQTRKRWAESRTRARRTSPT